MFCQVERVHHDLLETQPARAHAGSGELLSPAFGRYATTGGGSLGSITLGYLNSPWSESLEIALPLASYSNIIIPSTCVKTP